eukprot:189819_1
MSTRHQDSKKSSQRQSQSVSSIANALAVIDIYFDESDEEILSQNERLTTLREAEEILVDTSILLDQETPLPHCTPSASETHSPSIKGSDGPRNHTVPLDKYNTTTFDVNDDEIYDVMGELDKVDAIPQGDEDEETKEEPDEEQAFNPALFKSTLRTRRRTISNGDVHSLEKEIISDILERLKIAITFLLHSNSPLRANNTIDYALFHGYNNHIQQEDFDLDIYTAKINLLYKKTYKTQHKVMHKTWQEWQQYVTNTETDTKQRVQAVHALMEQHEEFLEETADDFILSQSIFTQTSQSLIASFAAPTHQQTTLRSNELVNMATQRQQNRQMHTASDRGQLPDFAMDLQRSADVLQTIEDRESMKQWIGKYKTNSDLIAKAFINCCCCNREYIEEAGQAELDITSPMTAWSWQNVVAFIESSEELRHLASVFWQYKLNGLELCKMGGKQLELLVECSLLSNEQFIESDFDRVKQQHQREWTLRMDAERFVYYKDKVRIESHVIAQYHLAMDILKHVIYGVLDNDDAEYKEFYQDFGLISDLLEILRAEHIHGSKEYWKMDAYFFDKIDNYLAILISNPLVLTMYHQSHCDFLVPPEKVPDDYVYRLMDANDRIAHSQSLDRQTTAKGDDIAREQSYPNSIKYITSKLNLMRTLNEEQSVRRRCTEVFAERFCCSFVSSSINTIYIPLLCLTVVALLSTSLFIILWFYSHGLYAQMEAMQISTTALGERIHNSIVDEFWVPQLLMSMAIGSLYHGDLHINAAASNGTYDAYLVAFSKMERAESIFGLGLYNADDKTLLMGYRGNTQMMIANYNGTCRQDMAYTTRHTECSECSIDCEYDPTTQAWYALAIDNMNRAIWTEPYWFAEGYMGMSLVSAIEFDETLVIFVCHMRVDTLSHFALLKTGTPPNSVLMFATSEVHIIASSTDEVYLTDGDPIENPLIASTVEYLNNQQNMTDMAARITEEYTLSVFPFRMVYVNFIPTMDMNATDYDDMQLIRPLSLNNSDDYQYGYLLITHDDTYLYNVDLALMVSQISLGVVLMTTIVLICVNMKYYDANIGKATLNANSQRLHWLSNANEKGLKRPLSVSLKKFGLSAVEMSEPKQRDESAYSAVSATMTDMKSIAPISIMQPAGFSQSFNKKKRFKIGDRVRTRDGKKGHITQITKLMEDKSFGLIGLLLEDGTTVFTNKHNIAGHEEVVLAEITETFGPNTNGARASASSSKKWEKAQSYSVKRDDAKAEAIPGIPEEEEEKEKRECLELTQQQLMIASFVQNVVLVLFLIVMWAYLLSSAKSDLTENLLAKHEWGSVRDEVFNLYDKAEMVLQIYRDRLERGSLDFDNDLERDRFQSNIMQSFVTDRGTSDDPLLYALYYTYFGTPEGGFYGVGWTKNETSHSLSNGVQSAKTEWILHRNVLGDDGSLEANEPTASQVVYDARCRLWYRNAMQYTFNGSVDDAFPNTSFGDFVTDSRTVASTPNCETSRRLFASMFNIELSSDSHSVAASSPRGDNISYAYDARNDTEDGVGYALVWSRYIFFSLGQLGLTASAAIQDPVSGDLYGVVGIDFTLGQLSTLLYYTVQDSDDDDEYAWIYDAQRPEMIASSEFGVLQDVDSHVEGCVSIAEVDSASAKVPYYAVSHPEDRIAIASVEINVTGLDRVFVNESQSIGVPINFPQVEAGRVRFYPGGIAGIDWIVAKTINDDTHHSVDSIQVTFFVSVTILVMTLFLFREFNVKMPPHHTKKKKKEKKDANYYYRLMLKMRGIVTGSANVAWKLMVEEDSRSKGAIRTQLAKQFLASRANEHIAAAENENELKFIECAWEAALQSEFMRSRNKKMRIKFFRFIESNLYGVFNQFFLVLHLCTSLFEPATPKQLAAEGLPQWIVLTTAICIVMEWCDFVAIIYRRYIEFSIAEPFLSQLYEINYGLDHVYTRQIHAASNTYAWRIKKRLYLVVFGPRCRIFLIHALLCSAILLNFVTRITFRIGYLSYYFPVLPFLLLIRNETVLKFSTDFIFAVLYCADVLFSYLCFILIFAVLSMSLFGSVVNYDRFNESFESISTALITAFVYISTSENYTFMYDVFDAAYYRSHGELMLVNAAFVSLLFAMIGLFIFVPMIIHRFELAFEERRVLSDLASTASKENAICAAFCMLDMNNDCDIDCNEFSQLVSSSILLDAASLRPMQSTNSLNIVEFVQHLSAQTFRTSIITHSRIPQQNKLRAWLECNVIRHRLYSAAVLIVCVMTFLMVSLLGGLEVHTLEESFLNYCLYALFALNFAQIHVEVVVIGLQRYWDPQSNPCPPHYVAAAMNKYELKHNKIHSIRIDRLSSSQRAWVSQHLADVRPLSIGEESSKTLINRLQLSCIWVTVAIFFAAKMYFYIYYTNDSQQWQAMNEQYSMYFLQLGVLLRVFFLIPINRKLIWVIFSVFPQFLSLFAFLGLFMYGYARIGCSLFGDGITDVVTDQVYPQSAAIKAKFNNLPFAMLALLQLMVGEGWHELMYFNVIATHPGAALYFIAYITAVTIIISNVFVGLFLSQIDELSTQQANDDIALASQAKTESFEKYAMHKLNLLNYKIKQNQKKTQKMQKQIDQIEVLLYHHKINKINNSAVS